MMQLLANGLPKRNQVVVKAGTKCNNRCAATTDYSLYLTCRISARASRQVANQYVAVNRYGSGGQQPKISGWQMAGTNSFKRVLE